MTTHVMHSCSGAGAKEWIEAAKMTYGWPHDKIAINKMRKGRDSCPYCGTALSDPSFEPVSGADAQLLAVNQRGSQFLRGGITQTKQQGAEIAQENRRLAKQVNELSAKIDALLKKEGA